LEIVVSDTGIGMSQEDCENIFQDFVRIKSSKTKDITGSGLGLSITKKMLDQYNGTIKVTSVPDKGNTFTITLPRN
jgi:two-component system, sensor histidine kinase and response regulator